jgi:hypothetical protein
VDVRIKQLIDRLTEHGWRVVGRETDNLDWWADEVWTVESEWAPRGFTIYLTLLVDPQWGGERRKGEGVWAVGSCLQRPTTADDAQGHPMLASFNRWPRDLREFLQGLSELRNAHLPSYNPRRGDD